MKTTLVSLVYIKICERCNIRDNTAYLQTISTSYITRDSVNSDRDMDRLHIIYDQPSLYNYLTILPGKARKAITAYNLKSEQLLPIACANW